MEDERGGVHYVCAVNNEDLRNTVAGDDQRIIPHEITGDDVNLTSCSSWRVGPTPLYNTT